MSKMIDAKMCIECLHTHNTIVDRGNSSVEHEDGRQERWKHPHRTALRLYSKPNYTSKVDVSHPKAVRYILYIYAHVGSEGCILYIKS